MGSKVYTDAGADFYNAAVEYYHYLKASNASGGTVKLLNDCLELLKEDALKAGALPGELDLLRSVAQVIVNRENDGNQ